MAYVIYILVSSVATGSFVMFPEFLLLLVALVAAQAEFARPEVGRQRRTS
jgi:hypothetical protein